MTRYEVLANPTGRFERGRPQRRYRPHRAQIIVDTYGGAARHGGGAFSGKDPFQSRPLRCLRGSLGRQARRCFRGSQALRTTDRLCHRRRPARFADGRSLWYREVAPDRVLKGIEEIFDLRPAAIIRDLDLRRPIYRHTATYGHFGRSDKNSPGRSPAAWPSSKRQLGPSRLAGEVAHGAGPSGGAASAEGKSFPIGDSAGEARFPAGPAGFSPRPARGPAGGSNRCRCRAWEPGSPAPARSDPCLKPARWWLGCCPMSPASSGSLIT